MEPEVGSKRRRIVLPTVDLPHPLSPTSPSVSPRKISRVSLLTAVSVFLPTLNSLVRFFTEIRLSLIDPLSPSASKMPYVHDRSCREVAPFPHKYASPAGNEM